MVESIQKSFECMIIDFFVEFKNHTLYVLSINYYKFLFIQKNIYTYVQCLYIQNLKILIFKKNVKVLLAEIDCQRFLV